jgi:hypothetical protein
MTQNALLNVSRPNTFRPNNGTGVTPNIRTEMHRLRDSIPRTKVEFIDTLGNVTDISTYYKGGARFDQVIDRSAGELQAGDFDIELFNHDNKFSEYQSSSLFYATQYHGAEIRISQGYVLNDGSVSYQTQAVGIIDQLIADNDSIVTVRCRDRLKFLIDSVINPTPASEVAVLGSSNVGNGGLSNVAVKPFLTKNELWTLTCTLGGGDATATFSVVGGTSGNVGTATSGTEFSTQNSSGGVKFLISAGTINWAIGDSITFTTVQHPEWDLVNIGKVLWSVLTGYNWDTNTQEAWHAQVLDLDHTQSTANTDIDYTSFVTVIGLLDDMGGFAVKGYARRDEALVDFIKRTIVVFLGVIFTSQAGRITVKSYAPKFDTDDFELFADGRQVRVLGYNRNIEEVTNYFVVNYKKFDTWEFSDVDVDYNGVFVALDSTSVGEYGQIAAGAGVLWYTTNGDHVQDMANKIITRYSEPPLNIDLDTGGDALQTTIGDIVRVTDTKYGFSALLGEVVQTSRDLDTHPLTISLRVRRDPSLDIQFGFLGSSADEVDGWSPQAASYDNATDHDKLYGYLGATGMTSPNYRLF